MSTPRPLTRIHSVVFAAVALVMCAWFGLPGSSAVAGSGGGEGETVRPFNGKDLSNWERTGRVRRDFWTIGTPALDPENPQSLIVKDEKGDALVSHTFAGADLYTKRKFKDARIELEVMLPENGNSGIFVMGEYEFQLRHQPDVDPDDPGSMDHGAIARLATPKKLVIPEPGEWQKVVIEYRAPRFNDSGEKTSNMLFRKVTLDGEVVHENVEVEETTYGGITVEEHPAGPLMLQGGERPAAFRDIKVTPVE